MRRTVGDELSALVRLALPLAVAQGAQILLSLVDTAVVGRAGALPLAGVGLGCSVYTAISILGWGFVMGLDPLIAQALGAKDTLRARGLLWQGLWLSAAVSVPLMLACVGIGSLLDHFTTDPLVAETGRSYLLFRLPGLPIALMWTAARSYLQAIGRTRVLVSSVVAANLLNLPADITFVFGGNVLPESAGPLRAFPAMGAGGAALTSTLCTLLQLVMVAYEVRRVSVPGWQPSQRRPNWTELRRAIHVGAPVSLQFAAEFWSFSLLAIVAARFGAAALAAHQLAVSIVSAPYTIVTGIGNAASVRVGLAIGARDHRAARLSGLCAFALGTGVMATTATAFLLVPGGIARMMTDDAETITAVVPLLFVAAIFQFSDGLQAVGAGVLRGAGDTRYAFLANMVGHWVCAMPSAVLLASLFGLGLRGAWWGFSFGLTVVAVALVSRFFILSRGEVTPLVERLRFSSAPPPTAPASEAPAGADST